MYYFLTGFTAKLAGTEIGVTGRSDVLAPASARRSCRSGPAVYARLLGEKLAHRREVWLVTRAGRGARSAKAGGCRSGDPRVPSGPPPAGSTTSSTATRCSVSRCPSLFRASTRTARSPLDVARTRPRTTLQAARARPNVPRELREVDDVGARGRRRRPTRLSGTSGLWNVCCSSVAVSDTCLTLHAPEQGFFANFARSGPCCGVRHVSDTCLSSVCAQALGQAHVLSAGASKRSKARLPRRRRRLHASSGPRV